MKPNPFPLLAIAALAMLPGAASAQAPANTQSVEMHQVRLQVKFVEVSANTTNAMAGFPAVGANTAMELLAARTKEGARMTEIALRATMIQDAPISTVQQDAVPFVTTVNGKPQTNFTSVPTSLTAIPHFNRDGTIRLNLTIQRSEVQKTAMSQEGPPHVLTQATTTLRTLKSGETLVMGGFVASAKPGQAHDAPGGGTETLVFVTATVLPDAKKP